LLPRKGVRGGGTIDPCKEELVEESAEAVDTFDPE
jgi:hypothetical protein